MSMPDSLKARKTPYDLADLADLAQAQLEGTSTPPVDTWHPTYVADMDMVIRRDGSWWHEGGKISRKPLVKLFASILRKDEDGDTFLVTPVEKLRIQVELAHFVATDVRAQGEGLAQSLFFTTNLDEIIKAGAQRPLRVETDPDTLAPMPFIKIRGRLEASLSRSVFYDLVELAVEHDTDDGPALGVWSDGNFFPLGPAGIHDL